MFDLCLNLFLDARENNKNTMTVFCKQYMFDGMHHASSKMKVIRFLKSVIKVQLHFP